MGIQRLRHGRRLGSPNKPDKRQRFPILGTFGMNICNYYTYVHAQTFRLIIVVIIYSQVNVMGFGGGEVQLANIVLIKFTNK
jgi:hypothetical protein